MRVISIISKCGYEAMHESVSFNTRHIERLKNVLSVRITIAIK